MGELLDINLRIMEHLEDYRDQCMRGVERSTQQIARLAIETSGQLEIDYEQTEIVPHLPESA